VGTLDGKVAIVVGSATNIGAETSRLMAKQGAKVVLADLNIKDAEAVASEICKSGGEAAAFKMDITSESDVKAMVEFVVKKYGGVDVLHNNVAAIGAIDNAVGFDYAGDILNIDMKVYDRTMAVNLRGFILTMRHVVPEMLKRGGGSIINTSSIASINAGTRGHAYAISKAGVNVLTLAVAATYAKSKIRCNAVLPGGIERTGNVNQNRPPVVSGPNQGKPKDIANMVVFLASDQTAGYINGSLMLVDGGSMLRGGGAG
jgi:NAD(P)-dependent dehydrogenase (short-subunit alcohol dehydrogenase family)